MRFTELREALRLRLVEMVEGGFTTGSELATQIGVAQAHISNFLHEKRGVSFDLADQLLKATELDVEDLITSGLLEERRRFAPGRSGIVVPIVEESSALEPRIQRRHVIGRLHIDSELLRKMKAPRGRLSWDRVLAIQGEDGRHIVVDRFDCTPAPGRFAVARNKEVQVGRVNLMAGTSVFCPDGGREIVSTIGTIVGRVILTQVIEQV